MSTSDTWIIYGANGYTGQLICEEAHRLGLRPILAGRRKAPVETLAQKYGWDYRVFDLDDAALLEKNIADATLVLHAAGPFRFTGKPMLEACLNTGVHYLDITGEIEVFALAHSMHTQAVSRNIMLMPGTGFDVVPTDCMAKLLYQQMPDATHLELAFVTLGGQISHGTAMSMSEKLGEGGMSRIQGKLVREPVAFKHKTLSLSGKTFKVMSIPWGDVYTAFITTGIPNIRAYTGTTPLMLAVLKLQPVLNPVLRSGWFKTWLQAQIHKRPAGPTPEQRARAVTRVWGQVNNAAGNALTHHFSCPEGYTLTARVSVHIAHRVLQGDWKAGYQTPAGCYGAHLVEPWIH